MGAAKVGVEVAAVAGFDKPSSVSAPSRVDVKPMAMFGLGKGIDMSAKASFDPEAGLTYTPMIAGIDYDEMDLMYIVGTPMVTAQFALVAATPTTLVASTSPAALLSQYTYVDFVSRCFRYTSGSIKIKCYITASLMHSVRLAFFLARNTTADWQSSYHQIVDVQGDTEVDFTLPYLGVTACTDQEYTDYWNLYVSILSFSQPTPAASNPIYLTVYKAGASDMQFSCHRDMQFTLTSNPRQDFAKAFPPFHESMVGYAPDHMVFPDSARNLRDVIHRMNAKVAITDRNWHNAYQFPGTSTVPKGDLGQGAIVSGTEMWGLLFAYWRGSMRVQHIRSASTTTALAMVGKMKGDGVTVEYIQGVDSSTTVAPFPAIEVPYYSDSLMRSTSVVARDAEMVRTTNNVSTLWANAAGDDFSFHFLKPMPNGTLQPANGCGYLNMYGTFAAL